MIRGYRVPAHVAGETVDGETIVIDLLTGAYHTLEGTSATSWDLLRSAEPTELSEHQRPALAALVAAGLAHPDDGVDGLGEPPEGVTVGLTSYTDMAELLLSDPVHEVDARGWPILRSA